MTVRWGPDATVTTDTIAAVPFKHTITHHHKVQLTVGGADGLEHKGDLAKLITAQS